VDIYEKIQSLIRISLKSVKRKLNPRNIKGSFEIFGYDFLVDEDLGVWLLEVNTNPCLDLSSPLLEQLIPRMIDDALKLTVDTIWTPKIPLEPLQTTHVLELPATNLWERLL
jgi:hypothetical protein